VDFVTNRPVMALRPRTPPELARWSRTWALT
jgi:hypothetical protein